MIAEHHQEASYVQHHLQKLCAFFAAMEEFAERLQALGHQVLHLSLDATRQHTTLNDLIQSTCQRYSIEALEYQRPDEYRLLESFRALHETLDMPVSEVDTEHFILPFDEIQQHFEAGKHKRMESFYRNMRRAHKVLMEGDEPVGGRWNFDSENRNRLNKTDIEAIPQPLLFATDVSEIKQRLEEHQIKSIGHCTDSLSWPVTREDSLQLLKFFCNACLPNFGRFQDALTHKSEFSWSLYHSRLSFAINSKLLNPKEVIAAAIASYQSSPDIDLAQVEGFVRQILGWREFVRGVYWANMPGYASLNHFQAKADLPEFFWSGETKMHCLSKAIGQSLDYAYAHHIQRLMITGNFCLLAGINPDQVDDWYLSIYIDAIEWVELPNTRGMAIFGDGGIVGTKPYAAGGNYVKKMSDYCSSCFYKVQEKTGPRACPLNSMYWHFMNRHRDELGKNHRTRMIYSSWDRMDSEQQSAILQQATSYLENLNSL